MPAEATFKQYSGYIPVDAAKTRFIFYWVVESQSAPATDPLVLWTNGGPGCSGLTGFFTENGPFRAQANGTLSMNQYAWNKVANMVFIEQPAGVGFSYITSPVAYGDEQAATDNYNFIKAFLVIYPQFASNKFYITSESYGGHYMPTLAQKLVDNGGVNFKGFMVGNPLTYLQYTNYGQYGTWYGHQLLPKPMWDAYNAAGCKSGKPSATCTDLEAQMSKLTSGMNPYGLDFPICTAAAAAAEPARHTGRTERATLLATMARARAATRGEEAGVMAAKGGLGGYWPGNYQPCSDNYATTYLNRADVQKVIGAKNPAGGWQECSDSVGAGYNQTDVAAPMMPLYQYLLYKGTLDILIYSGDDDSVCATMGTQQSIWDLGLKEVSPWTPWLMDGQTTGFHAQLGGLHFATVHGAGHMVPATRPAQGLQVFKNYLAGTW